MNDVAAHSGRASSSSASLSVGVFTASFSPVLRRHVDLLRTCSALCCR